MNKLSRVTLKDIARESNVSFSLVSKVLRNVSPKSVSREKAQLIRDTAARMGYVINKQARQLKTGKSMIVAVVIPISNNYETSIYPVLTRGILKVSCSPECNYDFVFFNTFENIKEYENLKEIVSINPDGIIYAVPPKAVGLSSDLERLTFLKEIAKSGKPILFCMEKYNIENTCSYLFNDVAGGYEATMYLINKGYKRIMFCRSPFDERMTGYLQAMTKAGLNYNGLITKSMKFSIDEGYDFFEEMIGNIRLGDLPDAIISTCDIHAIGILQAMEKHGLSQNDIAVMGYDGLDIIRLSGKSFPTVYQPVMQIGIDSATAITNWIDTGVMPENKLYKPEIKEILSTVAHNSSSKTVFEFCT